MKRYKRLLTRNAACISGTAVLSIAASFSMVFAGYSLSFLFTAYEHEGNKARALLITFGVVLGIWLAAMSVYYASRLVRARTQQRLKTAIRTMIGEKIASLHHAELTGKDSGHYVSWLTNDADQLYEQSFSALFTGIEELAATVFSLAALLLLSWQIGAAAIALLVVISVLPQLGNKWLQKANAMRSQAMEECTERYKDAVMGGSVLYLANLRRRIVERIEKASREAEKSNLRWNLTNITVQTIVGTFSLAGQVLLVFVALLAAVMGTAPSGAALSVGNLAGSFFNGAGSFVQAFLTVRASRPLWEKFEPAEEQEDGKKLAVIPEIVLENVSFAYGDRSVLKGRSFLFQSGGKYAVLGESGSGKSTLVKIMLGLLPGYTGEIRYGQLEQQEIRPESLYRHIAYVDQQVYLFQDTLRFNITLGESYTDEQVMAVVRQCKLSELVASLPQGLDSPIAENGKNLSGGQRQRIALARGLIRKVAYLILDEGTSALDEANAVDIENSLMEEKDLGVIIITHHLRESLRSRLTGVYSMS